MRRTVTWIVTAAAALATTTPAARADVYDDNPAAASRGPGDIYLFARATDGATLVRHWTGSGWSDWASLGGFASSGPAAAAYGNAINVFVRGGDGAIYQNALVDGAWRGWASLGGVASSAPAAVWRRGPANNFDLAVRGTDNSIYLNVFAPGTGWAGWASLGGNLTSGPALNSQSDGILNVFARGTDLSVFQKSWDGSKWIEWFTLGGGIVGAPSTISRSADLLNLYARGANDATYARSWSAAGWSAWALLDSTPVDSTPAPFSDDPSRESIVARRGPNLLLKSWTSTTGWGSWTDLGPIVLPSPPPAAPAPAPAPDGEVGLETGVRCTPAGGRLQVRITIRKPKGKAKPRVQRIVFYTKGKGRSVRVDRRSPFVVRIKINRAAGTHGRVYARVYYRRSKHGPLHKKTVSRRYTVCR